MAWRWRKAGERGVEEGPGTDRTTTTTWAKDSDGNGSTKAQSLPSGFFPAAWCSVFTSHSPSASRLSPSLHDIALIIMARQWQQRGSRGWQPMDARMPWRLLVYEAFNHMWGKLKDGEKFNIVGVSAPVILTMVDIYFAWCGRGRWCCSGSGPSYFYDR